MATYYVDATGGNDGNTGLAPGQAWQTLGKVNTEFDGSTFGAGDSILLKRGETWLGEKLRIRNCSGALGNHIVISTYDSGARPCIDQNGNNSPAIDHDSTYPDANYITVENLELTGVDNASCCRLEDVHHWTLSNLYIHDITTSFCTGIRIRDASHHVVVEDCTIDTIDGEGIYIGVGDDATSTDRRITVRNTYITATEREAIDFKDATRLVFVHNSTFDTCGGSGAPIAMSVGGRWNIIYECIFTGTTPGNTHNMWLGKYAGAPVTDSGRYLTVERCLFVDQTSSYGAIRLSIDNNKIVNCTFADCTRGITYDYGLGGGHVIKNNIFDTISQYPVYIAAGEDHLEIDFDNNCYSDGAADVWYQNGAARTFAFVQGLGQEANGITTAAGFAERGTFSLGVGSGCINTGDSSVTVYDYNDEYDGTDVDMGWREYGSWHEEEPGGVPHQVFNSFFEDSGAFARFDGTSGSPTASGNVPTPIMGKRQMKVNIPDTTARYAYKHDLGDLQHFYFAMSVNVDGLTMASGELFNIFEGRDSGGTTLVTIQLQYDGANTRVRAGIIDDSNSWTYTSYSNLGAGWNHVEIFWLAEPDTSFNTGELAMWLDEVAVAEDATLNNHDRLVDRLYVGAVSGLDAGTSGQLCLDAIRMDWTRQLGEYQGSTVYVYVVV